MDQSKSAMIANWRPPSWRSLRKPLLLILVSVVVLVVLWSTLVNYFLVSRDPRAAVDSYLSQLERGSARQVLAPLNITNDDPTVQILPNSVYRNSHDRPQSHRIVSADEQGTRAEVVADVQMGSGQTHRVTYTVEKLVTTGFLNDTWQMRDVDDVTLRVRLPAAVDALAVNGQTVRLDDAALRATDETTSRTWQFEGLPGSYTVKFPEDSYFTSGEYAEMDINIEDPQPATGTLELQPSPRMWEEVDRAISAAISECEGGLRTDPDQCPVPSSWDGDTASASPTAPATSVPEGVRITEWELESRPALVLEPDGEDPLAFRAQRYQPAVATVRYREGGETKSERVKFGVDVSVRSTGNEITTDVKLRRTLTDTELAFEGS